MQKMDKDKKEQEKESKEKDAVPSTSGSAKKVRGCMILEYCIQTSLATGLTLQLLQLCFWQWQLYFLQRWNVHFYC